MTNANDLKEGQKVS
ncbi:hypothetical protein JCM11641_002353, partial [Rhodosporidiobolus odoratus]